MRLFGPRQAQLAGPHASRAYIDWPARQATLATRKVLALDLETTGLDANRDVILSFGWVVIRAGAIELASARHQVVRTAANRRELASTVHGLGHDHIAGGEPLEAVLEAFLAALNGHILLAHFAAIEVQFLRAALASVGADGAKGGLASWPVIDTGQIERRRLQAQGGALESGALRLAAARARYGLPHRPAHNALSDALAAAELFLAQAAYRDRGAASRIAPFLSPGKTYL